MKKKKNEIIETINSRKIKLFGHLIQHNEFLNVIFKGQVLDKRTRERSGTSIYPPNHYVTHSFYEL